MRGNRFTDGNIVIKRIPKGQAEKRYNSGESILFIPCNLNPLNKVWGPLAIWESKDMFGQYKDFKTLCDNYAAYNCNCDYGRYISFYVRDERSCVDGRISSNTSADN